jgi:hypothetical protein
MKCMFLIPGTLVALLSLPAALAQPIRFVRESLLFTLAADSFSFSGTYYFDNPGTATVKQSVYYPFVISGSNPDATNITEVHTGNRIPVTTVESGVFFAPTLQPHSTQAYRISYAQCAPHRSLEYVLRTTAAWGEPIDRMTITIQAPADILVRDVSPRPDSMRWTSGTRRYTIERRHFMPGENLIVRWERKTP